MGVRVAYGDKDRVNEAIETGTIPLDCIVITSDTDDSELLFYDSEGNLRTISERTRFYSKEDATAWVSQYPCNGFIFTILENEHWVPYSVQEDGSLVLVNESPDIQFIFGGTAAGL